MGKGRRKKWKRELHALSLPSSLGVLNDCTTILEPGTD